MVIGESTKPTSDAEFLTLQQFVFVYFLLGLPVRKTT
jgi:hypothetical protein